MEAIDEIVIQNMDKTEGDSPTLSKLPDLQFKP